MESMTPEISMEILETMDKCALLAEKSKLIPEDFKKHLIYENLQKIPKHCLQKLVIDLELVFKNYIQRFIE
ncbi:MAG: hypothetical protein EAX96_10785 [Candidatus Lokiarchaeota archaeon]|nr:hypothetical protein [Candidatus Lokiarchaeota archaeon]